MSVKIHLEGDGLLYDSETNTFNAAQIIGFLQAHEAKPDMSSKPGSLVEAANKPKVSPREAIVSSGAKTNPQKIVALGHHVAEIAGDDGFSLEEVKKAFKRAGEPMPKNFGRDVKEAVKSSWIYEEEPDHYVLTEVAFGYIASGFPTTDKKTPKRQSGRRTSSARTTMNEDLYTKLKEKGANLKAYIAERQNAYDGKTSAQVAIIATWLSDEIGLDGLAPSDLQAVRRYLGEPAGNPQSQIINATTRDGYFSHKKDGRSFLSSKGEDFARLISRA